MIRTQVYLAGHQHVALKAEAADAGISMTELLRRIVDEHLADLRGAGRYDKEQVMAFVGLGRSGQARTAENHDDALDEALRDPALR